MRLWTISPLYLDAKGLVAAWREALLAQKVLTIGSGGYSNHPQLERFKNSHNPLNSISQFLWNIFDEATLRGYSFDFNKIALAKVQLSSTIPVAKLQIEYELKLLSSKLKEREPSQLLKWPREQQILLNSVFHQIDGDIASWEKIVPLLVEKS